MKKKGLIVRMFVGTMALALPCLAGASGLDATLLGDLGAIGSYCSRLEASHGGADAYLQALTRQFGEETTGSQEFRRAYDLMSDALGKLGRSQGLALCGVGSSVAPGGHGSGHESEHGGGR